MRNPFRQAQMRNCFDTCIRSFENRGKLLFEADKITRHKGNSTASMFWRGYDGVQIGQWDAASKQTFAYASWRAGKAAKAQDASA